MDIDALRYFAAAAKEEHFGRAADVLAISQPALSRSIARLEEYYGVALFERDGRGIRITRSGRALLLRVERVIAELEDARRELHDLSEERRTRPIALGFYATLGLRTVPDAIRRFREDHPDAEFRLLQGPGPLLQQRLMSGEIDLCLSSPRFAEVAVEWLPLWDEELIALVPDSHRLAGRGTVDLIELASDPFIALKPGYGLRQTADDLCREAGFSPHIAFEGEEVATLRGLVGAGFGVALVPGMARALDMNATALTIRAPRCFRTFGLSWARGRYLPQGTAAFRDMLVDQLQHRERRTRVKQRDGEQEENFRLPNQTGHYRGSRRIGVMKRYRFAALVALAVFGIGSGASGQQPPIRIGIVYSFSGAGGTAGKDFDDAWAVFVKNFGDTAGGRKVEIIRRDSGGISPENAKREAQELVVSQHVDMLAGLIFTPNAVAVGTVSTPSKTPVFIMNATTSNIMAKNPYMSRYSMSATQVTVPLAEYAYKSGMRNMYVVFMDYGPGIDSGTTFEKTFTAQGGKVAGEMRVPVEANDFSAYLQRIKDAKPDGIYIFLNASGSGTAFLKQAKAQGFDKAGIKIFCAGDLVTEQVLPAIGDAAIGVVSSMNYSAAHDSKLNRDFVKAYQAQSGGLLPTFGSVGVYDAFHAMYKVIDAQKGQLDPDKTMDIVKSLKFESPRGPLAIDPETRDIVQNVYIRRTEMRGGKLVNTEVDTYPMFKDPSEHP